jgi:phage tail sheath protein FI
VEGQFDLRVYVDGDEVERFQDLSRVTSDPRFAPTIVNAPGTGSQVIELINLSAAPGVPPDLDFEGELTGGEDNLDGIVEADFIGDEAAQSGLYALDAVPELTMLIVPGQASSAVHNAMVAYCEQYRDGTVFAILDPPEGYDAQGMVDYVASEASLENLSEFAAIYWPRVKIANPSKDTFGPSPHVTVAPSGIVAGVYSRTDSSSPGGVYNPPAGINRGRMFGVLGFATDETLDERKRDIVYPHRVNPLTSAPGLPRYIDGARTLKSIGSFPFVAERRGVMFIEQSLRQGLQFARHENNTPELRAQVRRTVTAFLLTQMRNGAFQTQDPTTAFYVDVSDKLNPPSVVAAGKLVVRVGLATNKPAEYVVLEISQDTRLLEEELATAG